MKLLLTSYGLTNNSISNALTELVGKEPNETKVAFIPSGANADRGDKNWMVEHLNSIRERGYHIDLIELTALSAGSIRSALENADVIFIGGGNAFYLSYLMQEKGMFDYLPELLETKVYAGISPGSMIAGDNFRLTSQALGHDEPLTDERMDNLGPEDESSAKTLHLVDFVIKPHFNSPEHFEVRNEEYIRSVANRVDKPIYAIDDQSALKIIDGNIEVVSEGNWLLLNS